MKKNTRVEENIKKNSKLKLILTNFISDKKKLIALLIILVIVIYAIFIIIKLIKNPTSTFVVENGDIYLEESTVGYILRDETIIEGNSYKNGMIQIKSEGEKVAKGEAIFRYMANNEEELNSKILELDEKIKETVESQSTTVFSTDIKLLDNQISEKLDELYQLNDLQEIKKCKESIETYTLKKAKIAGELSPKGSYLKQLIEERTNYENQLTSTSEYINATRSGIVSYRVDGLEDKLKIDNFDYLSKNFLDNLNLKTSQIIASNSEKAKIIDNFKFYITCVTNSEEAAASKVGDKLKIRLPSSEEVNVKIVYKKDDENNSYLLVFEVETNIDELLKYRKISFDIIWWSDSGLKIPNSAIQYDGDKAYVIRNRAGSEEKIWIKVIRKNDKYSIVDNYSNSEMQELGFDSTTIKNKKSISLYDEIKIISK